MPSRPANGRGARVLSVMNVRNAILLKTNAPAIARDALARERLSFERFAKIGANIFDISAPTGFGRTCLLAQWQGEAEADGRVAIWLSLDGLYTSDSFVQGLAQASMRPGASLADPAFLDWMREADDPMEVLTAWILELRESGRECLLLLDDVDLLPEGLQENELAFVIANAPGNLRVVLATRPGHPILRQPAFFGLPLIRITAEELRFRSEETHAVTERTLQEAADPRVADEIHRLTDGWPLGVRLALASQVGVGVATSLDETVSLALSQYFTDAVINRQPPAVIEMLASIALLDPIHEDLVRAVAVSPAPPDALHRLANTTPLIERSAADGWFRIHPAARDSVASLFHDWPKRKQHARARAASAWYADRGHFEEAAEEARRGGEPELAIELAERAVREMTVRGKSSEVIKWLDQLPAGELERRPGFWMPAAWAYANSNRPEQVRPLIDLLRTHTALDDGPAQIEIALIESTLAAYRDDVNTLDKLLPDLKTRGVDLDVSEQLLQRLFESTRLYLHGQPRLARDVLERAMALPEYADAATLVRALVDYNRGLILLWQGKAHLAYDTLNVALQRVKTEFHRRSFVVTLIAAALAGAASAMDKYDDVRAMIASRLHTLERMPMPDAVILGYLAAARLAEDEQRLDLADERLATIVSIGEARELPRMTAIGLSQLARFHARHGHASLARAALERLDALRAALPDDTPTSIAALIELQHELARARLPSTVPDDARRSAAQARTLAQRLERGADELLANALFGYALVRNDESSGIDQIKEAASTANAWGLNRLGKRLAMMMDPTGLAQEVAQGVSENAGRNVPDIFTPREYDTLCGLAGHLSNKEIALLLGVSHETIKWHLKNLYLKLDVSDRRSAVARARIMGMI